MPLTVEDSHDYYTEEYALCILDYLMAAPGQHVCIGP